MIAVDPRNAAMSVAHVFAQANVSDRDQPGTFRFDRTHCFLHDAGLGIRATGLLVFLPRNSEEDDRLKSGILRPLRFISNFPKRELIYARHARDFTATVDLLAHEQRQNEIMRMKLRLADEVPQGWRPAQSARTMDQFSHGTRLRIWLHSRKPCPVATC